MRQLITSISISLIGLLLYSCERRPLEEIEWNTALIPVRIDWSLADLDPDNDPDHDVYSASVWLFAKDGAKPFAGKSFKEYNLSSAKSGTIEVPVGRYSVLIFNNTVSDYSSKVGFKGTDNYETFEYYINSSNQRSYTPANGENVVNSPDVLAVWSLSNFEVTFDMITYTRRATAVSSAMLSSNTDALCDIQPILFTPKVHVITYVSGLTNAAAASGILKGMGSSVLLHNGHKSNAATYLFPFTNPQYDPLNPKSGTIEAIFTSLGAISVQDNSQYHVMMRFTLQDAYQGSLYYPAEDLAPLTFDVSNQVVLSPLQLKLNLNIGVSAGGEDPDVGLPDVGGKGFDIGVSGWGINIDIPMN